MFAKHCSTCCVILESVIAIMPSVFWRCWLGGRKGIRPVKNWVVGCWRGYLSGARETCMWPRWYHCHSVSCFSKIQIGFTFLVPAHLGSPWQRAVKRVCVCVCHCYHMWRLTWLKYITCYHYHVLKLSCHHLVCAVLCCTNSSYSPVFTSACQLMHIESVWIRWLVTL